MFPVGYAIYLHTGKIIFNPKDNARSDVCFEVKFLAYYDSTAHSNILMMF